MGVIRCDTCERTVDLDYDATPVYNEKEQRWICGICQEEEEIGDEN